MKSFQVCTLSQAKKLKKLGMTQESSWYWQSYYTYKPDKEGVLKKSRKKWKLKEWGSLESTDVYAVLTEWEIYNIIKHCRSPHVYKRETPQENVDYLISYLRCSSYSISMEFVNGIVSIHHNTYKSLRGIK